MSDSSTPIGYLFRLDGTAKSMREVWMALQDDVKGMSVFGRVMEGESQTQVGQCLEIRDTKRYKTPGITSSIYDLISTYLTGSTLHTQYIYLIYCTDAD